MKLKLFLLFVVLFSLQTNAQTLNPTVSIDTPGQADTFKGGYTFAYPSSGTPWSGPLISFGGFSNQYDCQLNSNYGGNNISFRTRNGDIGTWNAWNELATRGANTFNGKQTIYGNLALDGLNPQSAIQFESQNGFHRIAFHQLRFWDWQTGEAMTINDGYVGIGTTTPNAKLEVNGTAKINENLIVGKDTETTMISGPTNSGAIQIKSNGSLGGSANRYLRLGWKDNLNNFSSALSINDDLNVGIGTTAPDEKLTVKGKIHAQEVRVDLQGACAPDYVFQKYYTGKSELKSDYVMPTLAEIESFTKKNHHLPNVPSAQEVQQNGMSLGTMSNVLLQKVEELTLYAIEQNKELERLRKENNVQSNEIKTLKKENETFIYLSKRLTDIENQLK